MKIDRSAMEERPEQFGELNTGDQFRYGDSFFRKMNYKGVCETKVNSICIRTWTAHIFHEKELVWSVLDSEQALVPFKTLSDEDTFEYDGRTYGKQWNKAGGSDAVELPSLEVAYMDIDAMVRQVQATLVITPMGGKAETAPEILKQCGNCNKVNALRVSADSYQYTCKTAGDKVDKIDTCPIWEAIK